VSSQRRALSVETLGSHYPSRTGPGNPKSICLDLKNRRGAVWVHPFLSTPWRASWLKERHPPCVFGFPPEDWRVKVNRVCRPIRLIDQNCDNQAIIPQFDVTLWLAGSHSGPYIPLDTGRVAFATTVLNQTGRDAKTGLGLGISPQVKKG
jgi:hypothetical protein